MRILSNEFQRTCRQLSIPMLLTGLLSGCGNGDSVGSPPRAVASGGAGASMTGSSPDGLDRCALWKEAEVDAAIGPHQPGSSSIDNEWGFQSCRWKAATAQRVEGYPNGWFDLVEVAVFFKERESWAREQAHGDAVQGLAPGAVYDASYGELWFDCATRYCVVKVQTRHAERRDQIARDLAGLVAMRVH